MVRITAHDFWRDYAAKIRAGANRALWINTTEWTKFCAHAAQSVLQDRGLETTREYFRVDVLGSEKFGDCDWISVVAFEHENMDRNRWIQEFCKLTHVVADLRVIAGYFDTTHGGELKTFLQARVDLMEKRQRRVTRVPDSEWLFIFGPRRSNMKCDDKFVAFTLNGTRVTPLPDPGEPLCPFDWPEERAVARV